MKRLTETNKWSDPWFRKLSSTAKLLWFYMCDHADNIGLVDLDIELVAQDLRAKVTEAHLDELSSRIQHVGGSKYYITKFIPFQYGELSEKCIPHRKVISEIERHGITRVALGYAYPTQYPTSENQPRVGTTLKKGHDKTGKDKTGEGGVGETKPTSPAVPCPEALPPNLETPQFRAKWQQWKSVRMSGFRAPKSGWESLFGEQLIFLSRYDAATAIEILSASIRNGWQGLFEPRNGKVQAQAEEAEVSRSIHGKTYTPKQRPQRHEFASLEVFEAALNDWRKWENEGFPE